MSVKLIKWHLIQEPNIDFLIKTLSLNALEYFAVNVSDQEKVVMRNEFEVLTRIIKKHYKKVLENYYGDKHKKSSKFNSFFK